MGRALHLENIIRSLSRGQLLRVKASLSNSSILPVLFDWTRKLSYEECREKFNRTFPGNNLSAKRRELLQRIVSELASPYYSGDSVHLSSVRLIEIEFLVNQGQLSIALKWIRSARKNATELELYHDLIRLIQIERRIWENRYPPGKSATLWKDSTEEENRLRALVEEVERYETLYNYLKAETERHPREWHQIVEQVEQEIKDQPPSGESGRALISYHRIYVKILRLRDHIEKIIKPVGELIRIFERNPRFIEYSQLLMVYARAMHLQAALLIDAGRLKRVEVLVDRLLVLANKSGNQNLFARHALITLYLYRHNRQWGKASMYAMQCYPDDSVDSTVGILLKLQIAGVCFFTGHLDHAFRISAEFFNKTSTDYQPLAVATGKLLYLIVLAERNEFQAVEAAKRRVERYVKQAGCNGPATKCIFKLLGELLRSAIPSETKSAFDRFRSDFAVAIQNDRMGKWINHQIRLDLWAVARISDQPMYKVFKPLTGPQQ